MQLRGEVKDYDGKPIEGALIVNKRYGQLVNETQTDSKGNFLLHQMRLNDTIMVTAPNFRTDTTVYDVPLVKHPELIFWLKHKG